MKIVQLLVTLHKGDAIGNFTLALNDMLIKEGYDAEVYAYYIGENINMPTVKNISRFGKAAKDDLIIYQMCEGHEINDVIRKQNCKKVAIYHNLTPCDFFTVYGNQYYPIQQKAIKVIASMRDQFCKCFADSEFNKQDLIKMGYDQNNIDVIPVIIDFEDYQQKADWKIRNRYDDSQVNILFVGRLVPNKKQEDVIRIFAYYHNRINEHSRLFIIGTHFIPDYVDALKEYINYLGINDSVIMPGYSKFSEILSYYKCADIFLCMSEHEGFCVPLVESMMFDVPIIAYDSSAVSYTLGDSGVLVKNKDPKMIANIMNKIINDDTYSEEIREKQRSRLKSFEPTAIEKKYMAEIKSVIGEKE